MTSSIPSVSYRDFRLALGERTAGIRYPYHGTIEITPYCNLKCVHCYVSHGRYEEPVLSREEWCRIIDEVADMGCLWMIITGGEPLLRPDFKDIYTYIRHKGILITLFTNATLVTPEIAEFLGQNPPICAEITLYGGTAETYDKVTGIKGSFERCIRGIELLNKNHVEMRLKSVIMTLNKEEIHVMERYSEEMGIPFRWDASIMPRLDQGPEPFEYRLSPEEIIELELQHPERIDAWKEFCQSFVGPRHSELLYMCGAGKHSFSIDAFGRLILCLTSRSQSYDLVHGSFEEGWGNFLPQVMSQKASPANRCHKCELLSMCSCCPGRAELENGDPDSSVEWLCRLAHLRMEHLGLNKAL